MPANTRSIILKSVAVLSIVTLIGVFYLSTIREGHDWGGDDFCMYINHAKNLVEGKPYNDTGYLFNPFFRGYGPKAFPPLFPALLSPIYAWFGMNFKAMQVEIIFIFLLFLILIPCLFKDWLPFPWLILLILFLGFNPFFWQFKDHILSEIPFTLMVFLALFLIERSYQLAAVKPIKIIYLFCIALSMYLAVETRTIGIILLPSLLLYDLIIKRRLSSFSVVTSFIFILFFALRTLFLHIESNYMDMFITMHPLAVFTHLLSYGRELAYLWHNGYAFIPQLGLFCLINGLAVFGYLVRLKDKVTVYEIFLPLYVGVVIAYPYVGGLRYLIPIIPLYFAYFLVGLCRLNISFPSHTIKFLSLLVISCILGTYVVKYSAVDYGPIQEGIRKEETKQLFTYIRENTKEEDVVIFWRPRMMALFTGRKSAVYHEPRELEELLRYFSNINATHFIAMSKNPPYIDSLLDTFDNHFKKTFSNRDFRVYRILPPTTID